MCLMVSFTYSNQTKNIWNVSMLKYLNTHFCVIHWIIINLNRLKCDVVDLWTHKGRGWLRWAVLRGWRASQHSRQLSVTRCGSSWPHERGDMVHRCHTCPTGGVTMWQRSVSWWLFKHFNRDLWTFFHLLFFFPFSTGHHWCWSFHCRTLTGWRDLTESLSAENNTVWMVRIQRKQVSVAAPPTSQSQRIHLKR